MDRIPAATASIAAAITVVFAALGPRYFRSSTEVAVFAALCLAAAGAFIVFDFLLFMTRGHRPTLGSLISLVGGLLILGTGGLHAVAYTTALDRGLQIALQGMLIAVPIAAVCCLLGGLAQLPRSWLLMVGTVVCGAPLVGLLSIGPDIWLTRATTALVAALTATACIAATRHLIRRRFSPSSALALLAVTVVGCIMVYAIAVALTPTSWWQDFASPAVLAYGYAVAALAGTTAGFSHSVQRR